MIYKDDSEEKVKYSIIKIEERDTPRAIGDSCILSGHKTYEIYHGLTPGIMLDFRRGA